MVYTRNVIDFHRRRPSFSLDLLIIILCFFFFLLSVRGESHGPKKLLCVCVSLHNRVRKPTKKKKNVVVVEKNKRFVCFGLEKKKVFQVCACWLPESLRVFSGTGKETLIMGA